MYANVMPDVPKLGQMFDAAVYTRDSRVCRTNFANKHRAVYQALLYRPLNTLESGERERRKKLRKKRKKTVLAKGD